MIKQTVFATLVSSLLAVSSGCGLVHNILYGPCGGPYPCTACDSGYCGEPCGDECGPAYGPGYGPRTPVRNFIAAKRACLRCGIVHAGPCGECGEGGGCEPCGGCGGCAECGPLTWLFSIFRCNTYPCSGCGERYWGEWANDRPDCCDPCDGGNFAGRPGCQNCGHGGSGGGPGYVSGGHSGPGCKSCGHGGQAANVPTVPAPQYTEQTADDYVPRAQRTSNGGNRQYSTSRAQYAPRVLSVKDEVVKPAEAQSASAAPRIAQPRRVMQQQ